MDRLREFADPDELLLAEDLVILILRRPLKHSPGAGITESLSIDTTRRTLITTQKGLVLASSLLNANNVGTAVFAGCEALELNASFRSTAKKVLKDADTLAIVHNRDRILDLIEWFPRVKTLILPHNIRLQFANELCRGCPRRKSNLEELLGSSPAMGSTDLYMDRNALTWLLIKCKKLRRLDASFHGDMLSGEEKHVAFAFILANKKLQHTSHLRLGCHLERLDCSALLMDGVSHNTLPFCNNYFLQVTCLEVTMMDAEVVTNLGKFLYLTTLVVVSAPKDGLLDFAPDMKSALGELPLLEELSLSYFATVNVPAIAQTCPRVRKLSLMHCSLHCEEIADNVWDSSPPRTLEFLRLNISSTPHSVVSSLIMSCCRQVKDLRLDDHASCFRFLRCATEKTFDLLEELTLRTAASVRALLREAEYRTVVQALPALKRLTTDSYDLRLLFSLLVPKRDIKLAWCTCTVCAAEFPRVDEEQYRFWCQMLGRAPDTQ